MKKRKICIITGSRAEWGLFYPLAREIRKNDKFFRLQIIATGPHLSPESGFTYREIEKAGFRIDRKEEMLASGDTEEAVARSVGSGITALAGALKALKPDLVLLLGDRFETFSAAAASFMLKIPIAHLHGGELTEGAIDDGIRHSITKMASLHFTSTEIYRKRVVQMGESPDKVFNVGALGIDNVKRAKLLSKNGLEDRLGFKLGGKNILVTFHPVTLEKRKTSEKTFGNLLKALDELKGVKIIFTRPSFDMYSGSINSLIDLYVAKNRRKAACFTSMGRVVYLSAVRFMDAVAGNSSSGIIEVPCFGIPTVNIGDRQKGRARPAAVIDCGGSYSSIKMALDKAFSSAFRRSCGHAADLYGDGSAAGRIVDVIRRMDDLTVKKGFYEIDF